MPICVNNPVLYTYISLNLPSLANYIANLEHGVIKFGLLQALNICFLVGSNCLKGRSQRRDPAILLQGLAVQI